MSDLPRKKIEELLALYSLEESVFDIFVEGDCDRKIVNWFLTNTPTERRWSIYSIDSIDVSSDTVRSWNLTPSNRNEVLALCYEIGKRGEYNRNAVGVVDSDFDLVLAMLPRHALVLCTDYTCMEMYYFSEKYFQKMLGIAFNNCCDSRDMIDQIATVLEELFLIRLTASMSRLKLTELCFLPYIKHEPRMEFKRVAYIKNYLLDGYALDKLSEFETTLSRNRSLLTKDIRNQILGADFIKLLSEFLRTRVGGKLCEKEKTRPSAISALLACCLDYDDLIQTKLFSSILQRLNPERQILL